MPNYLHAICTLVKIVQVLTTYPISANKYDFGPTNMHYVYTFYKFYIILLPTLSE